MSLISWQNLPKSLQQIVKEVRVAREEMTPSLARMIALDAGVRVEDLMPWQTYDRSALDSYGRQLVFAENFFEIMVMSWVPGDVSAIHDHGYTQWGAVQVFGPAEHATFMVRDNTLATLSRQVMKFGQAISVGHQLIHQMGNQGEENFLTLHLYGVNNLEFERESVTAEARVWDITQGELQRTSGGVFFALPDSQISAVEPCPQPDYFSWLRNTTEYVLRLRKANQEGGTEHLQQKEQQLAAQLFDLTRWPQLESELMANVDKQGEIINPNNWNIFRQELKQAAHLQNQILGVKQSDRDSFATYAEIYDEVVGEKFLQQVTSKYIEFARDRYPLNLPASQILSIGCGTGIMEEYLVEKYGLSRENLLGIDISEAMVKVAAKKINAVIKNVLELSPQDGIWNIVFASMNVLQSFAQNSMEKALDNIARVLPQGGFFIGDFITPDCIRAYRKVIHSEKIISLKEPSFLEKDRNTILQNEIINISRINNCLRITDEGKHIYSLPSLWKMRHTLTQVFESVDLYDAITLEPLSADADTSPSTRYLVVAQKAY